ncbi:MAG TPA: hypothetical protein VGB02_10620 [Pyrinomonadaceae bacterium]
MEPITLTALATLLAPFFTEAGKTLAVESVKLALEKRHDIADSFLSLFKPEEFISLELNENQEPERVKALLESDNEAAAQLRQKIEAKQDLMSELRKIIESETGKNVSQVNINAKNIGAAGNVNIENQTNTFS